MGAIIKFFKSIIGFVTGLFGGKKGKDGFFMEAAAAPKEALKSSEKTDAEQPVATAAKSKTSPKTKTAAAQAKKGGKVAAAAATAVAATITATPKVLDSTDIIRAALASSQSKSSSEQRGQVVSAPTFAEMNAVPITTAGRRRPGANMTGFLDMAKTIKTRR